MNFTAQLFDIANTVNRGHCIATGNTPQVLLCGCCTFGCFCSQHAGNHEPHTCWYHNKPAEPRPGETISGLIGLVDSTMDKPVEHTKDEDCDVDPETGLCKVCRVDHSDLCPDCGGRGFHNEGCPQMIQFPAYVNVQLCDRAYGGAEEGGWYYPTSELVTTRSVASREEADLLIAEFEKQYSNEGRREISSVLSEGRYFVSLTQKPAPAFEPETRPHYE